MNRLSTTVLPIFLALASAPSSQVDAQVKSDSPASALVFPYVRVHTSGSVDTQIQLTNTSANVARVLCFYEVATGSCSTDDAPCADDSDCPGGTCIRDRSVIPFQLELTARQPVGWSVRDGGSAAAPGNGVVPAVDDDFFGALRCVGTDASGQPLANNAFVGTATVVIEGVSAGRYNAVGFVGTTFGDGDTTLVFGGADSPEYEGCPNQLLLAQSFDGAPAPGSSTRTVETVLAVTPCGADLDDAQNSALGTATLELSVTNDFGGTTTVGPFAIAGPVSLPLSQFGPEFDVARQGTLAGLTTIRATGSGVVGVALERHIDALGAPDRIAVRGVHARGARADADTVALPATIVTPTPRPTRTPTVPQPATPTPTHTASATPTPSVTSTSSPASPTPTAPEPTATGTSTPTPTASPTRTASPTNTATSTDTPVSTATPTAAVGTPPPTVPPTSTPTLVGTVTPAVEFVTFAGICRQPGDLGLEPCPTDSVVTVFSCLDPGCQSLSSLGSSLTDREGRFAIRIDAALVTTGRRIVQADLASGARARVAAGGTEPLRLRRIDYGPVSNDTVRIVDLNPVTEATVRLLEEGGLENYLDTRLDGIVEAVAEANAATVFAGQSLEQAIGQARDVAFTAPSVRLSLACTGDCSLDRAVTVDEVIVMVSIALGLRDFDACPASDSNGDGEPSIDEIVDALNIALNGCRVRIDYGSPVASR